MRNRWLCLVGAGLLVAALGCGDDDGPPMMDPDAGDAGTDADTGPPLPTCTFGHGLLGGDGEGSPPPDGLGGEGDLEVTTDTLRAVFAAVDRPVGVAASGGTLMDLHLLGQSDHMNELSQLAGVSQGAQIAYTAMEVVEEDDTHLVVEVRGHVQPQPVEAGEEPAVTPDPGTDIEAVTRYEFRCAEPRVWMDTTLTNASDEVEYVSGPAFAVYDVMFWGQKSLHPFCPARGQGDACTPFDIDDPLPGLVESEYVGSTGSVVGDPGSFAFYIDDPEVDAFIGVHDDQVSAFGYFVFGADTLRPGETRTARRVVVVGDGADAASATDIALEGLAAADRIEIGTVTGTVALAGDETISSNPYDRPMVVLAEPGAGDATDPEMWTPHTMVRVQEDGSFSARVPSGDVAWEVRAPGHPPMRGEGGTVEADGTLDLGTLELDPLPLLQVQVRDVTSGSAEPLPARLMVVGAEGTETPRFGPAYGGSPASNVVLTDGMGDAEVRLPAGDYDVYATHGPTYTLVRERVTMAADTDETLEVELQQLDVIPDGFVTADFHVHSGASYDSSVPMDDRVRAFLAEGVQAMVSTEHDVIFDHGPALAAVEAALPLAWQGRMRTFVGLESTATVPQEDYVHTIGHHNSFPLTVVDGAHKNGAPDDEYVDVGTLYDRLRSAPSPVDSPLIQLNHARAGRFGAVWLGYFDTCGFLPTAALDPEGACFGPMGPMGARPWDMDAMEVINGPDALTHIDMSRDWHALIRQSGEFVPPVGTANSDTHTLTAAPGYPMTVLRTDAALDALDDATLVETVRSGSVAGSLGVFTWVTARENGGTDTVEPGRDPLVASSGEVVLDVRVAAPPWVPVEEIRVRVNGEIVERLSAADGDWSEPTDPFGTAGVVRFEGEVDLSGTPLSADAFVTVEAGFALPAVADVDGDGRVDATDNDDDGDIDADDVEAGGVVLPEAPEHLGALARGALPMSFTNPIYVEVDGGGWSAPGTPLP